MATENQYEIFKASNGIVLARVFGLDNAHRTAKKLAQSLEIEVCYCNGTARTVTVRPEVSLYWVPDFPDDDAEGG